MRYLTGIYVYINIRELVIVEKTFSTFFILNVKNVKTAFFILNIKTTSCVFCKFKVEIRFFAKF